MKPMPLTLKDVKNALDKEVLIAGSVSSVLMLSIEITHSFLYDRYTITEKNLRTGSSKIRHYKKMQDAVKVYNNTIRTWI